MRVISKIFVHCTASPQNTKIESIQKYWREVLGWKKAGGYHYIIEANGNVIQLSDESKPTNGVAGHNANSIHISYIGGVDSNGKSVDNRTPEQKNSMYNLIMKLKQKYPNAEILGHRDVLKKGVNWKDCPSFDVKTWLKSLNN